MGILAAAQKMAAASHQISLDARDDTWHYRYMDSALIPKILVLSGEVTLEHIRREVIALGHVINQVVKKQPLARFTGDDGKEYPGHTIAAPEIRVNLMSPKAYTCNGRYGAGGDVVEVNVGPQALWGDIVETITHELCHRLRPVEEIHTPAFWGLLSSSLQATYGVCLPGRPPKGQRQYWRDWVAAERIRRTHDWANVRPLMPDHQATMFHYERT